jgi:hypothetical protein
VDIGRTQLFLESQLPTKVTGGRAYAVVGVAAGHANEPADPASIFGEEEAAKLTSTNTLVSTVVLPIGWLSMKTS